MNYIIFAGEIYYPAGGTNDLYAFADTLDDAMNYYYESQVSGLHNRDYLSKSWWGKTEKEDNTGNQWAHIFCLNTKKIIKETKYEDREEYEILKNLRDQYSLNELKGKMEILKSLSKKQYIIQNSALEYEIIYNLFIHKYLEKGLSKKEIKNKLWWIRKKKY